MATKDEKGKTSPVQKGGQPQQSKIGKESRKSSTNTNNMSVSDMEQQNSSNKGKGPAGENL